ERPPILDDSRKVAARNRRVTREPLRGTDTIVLQIRSVGFEDALEETERPDVQPLHVPNLEGAAQELPPPEGDDRDLGERPTALGPAEHVEALPDLGDQRPERQP